MLELGKEKKVKCLEVKIDGNVYHIPSAKSMPVPYAKQLCKLRKGEDAEDATLEFFFDFLGNYLGDALDVLDMEDLRVLMAEWGAMNSEEGASLGE